MVIAWKAAAISCNRLSVIFLKSRPPLFFILKWLCGTKLYQSVTSKAFQVRQAAILISSMSSELSFENFTEMLREFPTTEFWEILCRRSDGQCRVQVSDLALIYNYFVETLAKPEKSRLRIECVQCPDCESSDCESNQDCKSSVQIASRVFRKTRRQQWNALAS